MGEVKPCPFCGCCKPPTFRDGSTFRWGIAECSECGATAGETRREYPDKGEWHDEALAAWNTRAVDPELARLRLVEEAAKEVTIRYTAYGEVEMNCNCKKCISMTALRAALTKEEK